MQQEASKQKLLHNMMHFTVNNNIPSIETVLNVKT